jgi:hypothetical protein
VSGCAHAPSLDAGLEEHAATTKDNGRAVEAGRVSADPNTGVAQTTVTIPATATPGTIGLTIGFAQRADVTVTVK